MKMKQNLSMVVALSALIVVGADVRASEDNPFLGATISIANENGPLWGIEFGPTQDGSPTYNPEDGGYDGDPGFGMDWFGVSFDADPFIAGGFVVTNNMAVDQTFTLTVSMPTAFATGGSTTIDGSSALTIADANGVGGGVLSTSAPDPVYSAEINGGTVARTLFDHDYSLTAPALLTNNDGMSYVGEAGPAVGFLNSISIVHTFTVTPGDRATVNSTFNIVPEPATLALFGLGAISLIRRRR